MSLLVWGILFLIPIYFIFFYKSRAEKCLEKFPHPKFHPILGVIPLFLNTERKDLLGMMMNWSKDYGAVFRLWSPFGSAVMFTQASSIEKLLTSTTNLDKGFDYDYVKPWLGDGLLLSTGVKWGHHRKMLTPTFHFKILEDFMTVFNREGKKLVSILKRECCEPAVTFDIHAYVTRCALDIICETAMGKTMNAQDDRNSEYIRAINEMGRLIQDRSFRPWLRFDLLWRLTSLYRRHQKVLDVLHGFTEKVIKEKKEELAKEKLTKKPSLSEKDAKEDDNIYFQSKKRRLAFLDLLLDLQSSGEGQLSDTDIREQTDTFMFAGHDTTAANMSFTLYALACNPEVQRKVQLELDEIFGDDKDREITTEDLTKMKYLECTIKESLRIYPSVPFIQRKLTSDLTLQDGRIVPTGTTVGVFIYHLHRDPNVFRDPEVFRPERFLSTGGDDHAPFTFVPFSAGPRNCIGQKFAMLEEKILLSTFLRSFSLESMLPPEQLPLVSEVILKSESGLPVRIAKR